MATFPDILTGVSPINPWVEELNFKTLKSEFEGNNTSVKQKWLYPRRNYDLRYQYLSVSDAKTLYNFFVARAGGFDSFVLFCPFSDSYTGEYVGVGDGTTTAFNAPGKTISAYSVYVDGVLQTYTTHYTVDTTGGSSGEAEINFVAAPDAGDHITISFTGYLKVVCRFAEDMCSFENFYNRIVNTGLKLQGLLNE